MPSNPPLPSHPRNAPTTSRTLYTDHSALVAHPDGMPSKKRKIDRACDGCRRKKTRCDGPWTLNNVCTNCIQSKKACTYVEASKPRGPPKAYVVGLEDRVEELEALLAQIKPGVDFSDELGQPVPRDSWKDSDEDVQVIRKHTWSAKSTPAASGNTSTIQQPSSSTQPLPTSLPPLIIPFHQQDEPSGTPSPTAKTTHLQFRSQKPKNRTTSGRSSASVSSPATTKSATMLLSPLSLAPSSESAYYNSDDESDKSDELVESSLAGRNPLTLRTTSSGPHPEANMIVFHGRSSTAGLVEATRRFKHLHMQETMKMDVTTPEETAGDIGASSESQSQSSSQVRVKLERPDNSDVAVTRRPQFWKTAPWELGLDSGSSSASPTTISAGVVARFPPQDLCETLIDIYFLHSNSTFPLLHRPTFEQQWSEKLHEKDFWFAAGCLMLFSVASRWCTDERVLDLSTEGRNRTDHSPRRRGRDDGCDKASEETSQERNPQDESSHGKPWWNAGLPFFDAASEVIRANANMVHSASLFEVQTLTLMATYLRGTNVFPAAWIINSIGLRRALDAGAHRKQIYRETPTPEDELWKRAFWILVAFDRIGGVILGRSVGIGEEDFDLEFPLEVDDPYWGDTHGWKQPENVTCTISAFNHFLRLTQVIAFTSRTIYAINKPKVFSGLIKGDWQSEVVTQLNTALEEWTESIPPHLKWSEDISDPLLYNLSATLATTYHLTRLLIYRPFIPPPPLLPPSLREEGRAPSSTPTIPFPALAICLSSARACTRILEHQLRKQSWDTCHIPNFVNAAYVCAGLFLLALWDLKGQQKALLKLQGAGVVSSANSSNGDGMEKDGRDRNVPEDEDIDTNQVLQTLKEKMEDLLSDIHILIEALQWAEPRWQFVGPMVAQLKGSLPEQSDLDFRTPTPPVVASSSSSRKSSFQDIRRQRQQQKLKRNGQSQENDEQYHGLTTRHSHPSLISLQGPTHIDLLRRSPPPGQQRMMRGSEGHPGPTIFVHEHYPHLHTMADEDFEESPEHRIQLPRVEYDPPTFNGGGQGKFLADQTHQIRQAYSVSPSSTSSGHVPEALHQHQHDPHRRPAYRHQDDVALPRHPAAGPGSYSRDGFAHPASVPYISGSVRRSSMVLPRPHDLNESGHDLHYPQRMLGTRTPSFDDFRSDALPPKFRLNVASRSSVNPLDRGGAGVDDDRKPLALSSPSGHRQEHRDGVDSGVRGLDERQYHHERRSDVRTGMHSPYANSFPAGLELRYPWPAAEGQDRPQGQHLAHTHNTPSYHHTPNNTDWKQLPPAAHQQQQHGGASGPGPSGYSSNGGYGHYQQIAVDDSPLMSPVSTRSEEHRPHLMYPGADATSMPPGYGNLRPGPERAVPNNHHPGFHGGRSPT
ncbi:fungal-specific transcription factor domain-containing protein [Ephemerocybe angulata]|uniref:Fungal-specific transcription factor domain-containing protein n=1 Tax=Ephemerocybe angulata TaxID=980116 RepID=A0A8H6I971_9AGAR|nr:fungal-specific transcription factor domain-containing protein [Tulosesus angulatus]